MTIRTYPEGQTVTVTADFRADGAEVLPTTVDYKVECETSRETLIGWTSVTPAASVSITVAGTANVLINESRRSERKVVTVVADRGLATQFVNAIKYDISNLQAM